MTRFVLLMEIFLKVTLKTNQILYFSEATPLGQVKLGQLPGWLLTRSKNPADWARAVARGWWRWRYEQFQF
jgi:hypothetical protein